jgi:3-phosphoinositide dependent protein kinase-1
MNGDLSLSRALGGLRIANPDDSSSPSPQRERSAELPDDRDTRDIPQGYSAAQSALRSPLSNSDELQSRPAGRQTYESAAAILKSAQTNLNAAQRQQVPPAHADHYYQHQHQSSAYVSSSPSAGGRGDSVPTERPISGVYGSPAAMGSDTAVAAYNAMKSEPARSSVYGMPTRTDSRSNPAYPSPIPSRESSHRDRQYDGPRQHVPLPAGSGPLPPRRSSKGMGGGYASIPSTPPAALQHTGSYGPDVMLPKSSEDWQEKGASVSVRREVDSSGKTVLRTVKKGVKDFKFGRVLGEGSYSTVYLATDRQSLKDYAIKVLEKKHIIKEKKIKYVNIEKNTLNRLTEHPGIVRLYYTFQDETSLYYVLDLCNGGELLGVLKRTGTFDMECTRFYGAQILDSIDYMHSRGVIHRDLKPENVLLDDRMHIKITDFGTAKLLPDPRDPRPQDGSSKGPSGSDESGRSASFVGTAEYVSPELLTDKSASKASDIWAFGCIIYQLLAGRPPFKGGSEYLTFQKIVGLEYEFPAGFPHAARDLVERCLVLDPARRLTIEHIRNHEFFDGQPFGKELWKMKAPRLRPHIPQAQEPHIIQLNGASSTPQSGPPPSRGLQSTPSQSNGARPNRLITELPPPTQLDLDWSPVLTRQNERILKLGDLMVISSPLPSGPYGRGDDGHKKLSRFFGGSTTKKRQRLVMITSSGRIVLAPAGGEEKKSKQEISLLAGDCTWRAQVDAKGQPVWCVDTVSPTYF